MYCLKSSYDYVGRVLVYMYCERLYIGELKSRSHPLYQTYNIVSYTRVIFFWKENVHVTPTLSWHNDLQEPTIFYPPKCRDTFT